MNRYGGIILGKVIDCIRQYDMEIGLHVVKSALVILRCVVYKTEISFSFQYSVFWSYKVVKRKMLR